MFSVLNLNPALAKGAMPCALTIGNFDGVHRGHQAMLARLKQAAAERGLPAAVMTFEPHPREVFTPELAPARLTSLREKIELFKQHGVDRIFLVHFSQRFAGKFCSMACKRAGS
jgi:riboflavin kinase/FMN adenylyltransferase